MGRAVLLFLALLAQASPAADECICTCVNGQTAVLCRRATDLEPICPPRICPIVPPSIQPIDPPQLPPLGATSCKSMLVLNPATGRYEWHRVCQ